MSFQRRRSGCVPQLLVRIRRGCASNRPRRRGYVVGAEFFLGVDAGDLAHFAAAIGAGSQRNRQPQDQAPKPSLGHPSWNEKKGEVPPLRNPTISREVRWEEKIGLLRSG